MTDFFDQYAAPSLPVQLIGDAAYAKQGVCLAIKRLDAIHPQVSGNKFFKLKYNLREAIQQNHRQIITFGGAHSNHIAATAFAVSHMGLAAVGVIRGDELAQKCAQDARAFFRNYPTLKFAHDCGMNFEFVSRADYRLKTSEVFLDRLVQRFGASYIIPEGGSNALAVKGCADMLSADDMHQYDVVACAVGSGGTLAGISQAISQSVRQSGTFTQAETPTCAWPLVLGVAAVRDHSLPERIMVLGRHADFRLISEYTFGGFAKVDAKLIAFINQFSAQHAVPLEPVYTGKLMYALDALIRTGYFARGSRILALHTGGLQGMDAMQQKLARKGLPKLLL